jgi:mRNA interferase HigB
MHIISFKKIRDFFLKEPNSRVGLQDWFKIAKKSNWDNFADLKNTFNSVDNVGNNRYVFNIKGNNYRVVAIIRFNIKRVFIRWIGKHKDYDNLKDINKL